MKKITRRSFLQASGAAAVAGALAACTGGTSSSTSTTTTTVVNDDGTEEEVVIETLEVDLIFADGDESAKEIMTNIIDGYNESQPYYHMNIIAGDGSAYSEILQTKIAVDEFPDIVSTTSIASYVRAGKYAPLSPEIEALFTAVTSFDGVAYTAPLYAGNTLGIMYNEVYFAENNLSEPATWDEFIQLCEDITALGDMDPLVVGAGDTWHLGFWWQTVYSNNVLSDDLDFIEHCYGGEADFTDARWQAAMMDLNTIIGYAQDGWASTEDALITTFFVNDMCAMLYSGTHQFANIITADADFAYGWFPVADRDGKVNIVGLGGADGWALSQESLDENPEMQNAFDDFVTYFFSKDVYKYYCEEKNLSPTTVDAPDMECTSQFQEVLDCMGTADALFCMWNSRVDNSELPSGFRDFCYKTFIEYMQGTRSMDSSCAEMQNAFDVAAASFNPVTGVGITSDL